MLPKTSRVSIIRPSTKFPVNPRLLCTKTSLTCLSRCPTQRAGLQRRSYASHVRKVIPRPEASSDPKTKRSPQEEGWNGKNGATRRLTFKPKYRPGQLTFQSSGVDVSGINLSLQSLRRACEARNVPLVMDLYPILAQKRILERNDALQIARTLHNYIRHIRSSEASVDAVFPFVQQLVQDIQTGNLPPHHYAHVHLLGIFKECKKFTQGQAFWEWLVKQDYRYASQAVYGAAIELLTYGKKATLPDLESLYMEALKRFPGTFAEYHLSPDAIIPDRTQPTTIADIPMLLLQGILTARMLSGNWRDAYLAFDTGLRLFPTQLPARFYLLFMSERPLPESYTAFLIACRAGHILNPQPVSALITDIRATMKRATSLRARVLLLRAMANTIYAYLQAGGNLEVIHVGIFFSTCESLLLIKASGKDYEGDEMQIRNAIVTTAHEILSTLMQAGMPASENVFNGIIHLAGAMRVPALLKSAMQDWDAAGIPWSSIGMRTVLSSAGHIGDKALIEKFWNRLVSLAEAEGNKINEKDWTTLVRACVRAEHVEFYNDQTQRLEHTLSENLKTHLNSVMLYKEYDPVPADMPFPLMRLDEFAREMKGLSSQFKDIAAVVMSGRPLDQNKTPFHMFLDSTRKPLGTPENLRDIYNELTIDPHQPPAPRTEDDKAALPSSSTGIPLDELRFQNWVSITEMMDQAQNREGYGAPRNKEDGVFYIKRRDQQHFPLPAELLRPWIKQLRTPSSNPRYFRKIDQKISHHLVGPARINVTPDENTLRTGYPSSVASKDAHGTRTPRTELDTPESGTPSLSYYISTESDHVAPSLDRRPLKNKHALGLQPKPDFVEESTPAESTTAKNIKSRE
jgi:hypothetical protein